MEDVEKKAESAKALEAQKLMSKENEIKPGFGTWFTYVLPVKLINWFQILLIVEKLFEIGTFAYISWWMVFIPTFVEYLFMIFWPTPELKEIVDKVMKEVDDSQRGGK